MEEFNLFHFARTKNIKKIKQEGFETHNPEDYVMGIKNALKHFKKEKVLTSSGIKGEGVRSIIREVRKPSRHGIWFTTDNSNTAYAKNYPEHISLALVHAGISSEEIQTFLERQYGKKVAIKTKLKHKRENNVNFGLKRIPREQIEDVFYL